MRAARDGPETSDFRDGGEFVSNTIIRASPAVVVDRPISSGSFPASLAIPRCAPINPPPFVKRGHTRPDGELDTAFSIPPSLPFADWQLSPYPKNDLRRFRARVRAKSRGEFSATIRTDVELHFAISYRRAATASQIIVRAAHIDEDGTRRLRRQSRAGGFQENWNERTCALAHSRGDTRALAKNEKRSQATTVSRPIH